MPSLAALAAKSTWEVSGDDNPVLSAELVNFRAKELVLFRIPLITC